jgi:hypothetical protein
MFTKEILVLAGTAATIGFVHTVLGPDHYIPFIAMSRARRWTLSKTLFISFLISASVNLLIKNRPLR